MTELPPPSRVHHARPGVRIARICPKCQARDFGRPDWKCPTHNVADDQANRPYRGQATT